METEFTHAQSALEEVIDEYFNSHNTSIEQVRQENEMLQLIMEGWV